MSHLLSLYRSRRGEAIEQTENFLSSALGLLLTCSDDARTRLARPLGFPAKGRIRVSTQQSLFDARNEVMGRPDLTVEYEDGGTKHTLLVEVKWGAPANDEQLRTYRSALKSPGGVVLLSRPPTDAKVAQEANASHVTWAQVVDALAGSADPLTHEFLDLLSEQGLPPVLPMKLEEVTGWRDTLVQQTNAAILNLLPTFVASDLAPAFHDLEAWFYDDEDLGRHLYLSAAAAKRANAAFTAIGLSGKLDRDRFAFTLCVTPRLPRTKKALLRLPSTPWMEAEDGSLTTDLEPLADGALSDGLARIVAQARGLLRTNQGWKDAGSGTWGKGRRPDASPTIEGDVPALLAAVSASRRVTALSSTLSTIWLRAAHARLEAVDGSTKRIRHAHEGSFYTAKDAIQVGARVYPGAGEQTFYAWVWTRDRALLRQVERNLDSKVWSISPSVNFPKNSVICCANPKVKLVNRGLVEDLGSQLADAVIKAVGFKPAPR